jgi:hypothetical protein
MSIYAIKRNASKGKYVEIFTHCHVGSTGPPSRRTVFVSGTSAEERELDKNNSIQSNYSMIYCLCIESTATRPITDIAQCRYNYIMDRHIILIIIIIIIIII